MRKLPLAVLAILGIAASATAAKKPKPPCVTVFVTSVGAKGGFTDPNKDNRDSMKDLAWALANDRDSLCVVAAREKARIVLEVQSRERSGTNRGIVGPARDSIVHVKFIFGGLETEMNGSSDANGIGTAWQAAANSVAGQVEKWVKENREALAAAP